jgi:hypothetical protein
MRKDFPKVFREMSGNEEFCGEGGLPDAAPVNAFEDTARDALNRALAAFRAVTDPYARGELVELSEEVAARMKAEGNWEPRMF